MVNKIYYIDNPEKVRPGFLLEEMICLSPSDYIKKEKEESDQIVVLCELNIDLENQSVNRTDFYGISFVQELRRKGYKNKVLFLSFLPASYYHKKVLKAGILFFLGHSFLQLPSPPSEWPNRFKTFEALTDLSLYDVRYHYCGIKQIISEHFHRLAPKYNAVNTLTPSLIREGENLMKLIFDNLDKPAPPLDKILASNISGSEALRSLRSICEAALPESTDQEHHALEPEWRYWKVLWLDDSESKESPLFQELVRRLGAEDKVILCTTYEEALKYWLADKEISLVICDYRLKDEHGLPTSKQGYDFIKCLADDGRSVGKIAYSGLRRKFLIESFKHYGIQINAYSKIDFNQYDPDDLTFLADEIIRLGDKHWIEINNAPQAKEWNNIATTYHKFKNSFSFHTFQKHLSRLAHKNLETFIEDFNNQKTEEDIWNITFRDSFTVRTGGFPKGKVKRVEAIQEILTTRRFAIGLYAFLKSKKSKHKAISLGLSEDNHLDYIKVILYNSSSNGRGYSIDLSDPDFFGKIKKHSTLKLVPKFNALTFDSTWPLGLLPEELGWLKFDLALIEESHDEIHKYLSQIRIVKNHFKFLFSEKPFSDLVSEASKTLKIQDGKIFFNDENTPLIRNTEDAKKVIQSVYGSIDINDFEAYSHFISFWRSLVSQLKKKNFRGSTLISELPYFLTKTLQANKLDFDSILDRDNSSLDKPSFYSVEEEFMLKYRPWEKIYPKNRRMEEGFQQISDELFEAIKSKNFKYKRAYLKNKDEIFSNTLLEFIYINSDKNNLNKNRDMYLEALKYKSKTKDRIRAQYKTLDHAEREKADKFLRGEFKDSGIASDYFSDHEEDTSW